jgi:hypothetical protein
MTPNSRTVGAVVTPDHLKNQIAANPIAPRTPTNSMILLAYCPFHGAEGGWRIWFSVARLAQPKAVSRFPSAQARPIAMRAPAKIERPMIGAKSSAPRIPTIY